MATEEPNLGEQFSVIRNGRRYDTFSSLAMAIQHARILSEEMHGDKFQVVDQYGQLEFEVTTKTKSREKG